MFSSSWNFGSESIMKDAATVLLRSSKNHTDPKCYGHSIVLSLSSLGRS